MFTGDSFSFMNYGWMQIYALKVINTTKNYFIYFLLLFILLFFKT